jgi:hypothetical protein
MEVQMSWVIAYVATSIIVAICRTIDYNEFRYFYMSLISENEELVNKPYHLAFWVVVEFLRKFLLLFFLWPLFLNGEFLAILKLYHGYKDSKRNNTL